MENYQKYQSTLPDEDLIKLAFFERGKIKKQARISAKKILQLRNLSNVEIEKLKDKIRKRKREEIKIKLKSKNNKYRIWDFLMDMIIYS